MLAAIPIQIVHTADDRCCIVGQSGRDVSTRRVDVQLNVLAWRVCLEEEELRDDNVRYVVVDLRTEKDDPVHEQT